MAPRSLHLKQQYHSLQLRNHFVVLWVNELPSLQTNWPESKKMTRWVYATWLAYAALFIWILCWNAWINPPHPTALALAILLGPLLLTLRGLLYVKLNALIVISLLTPFYLALGINHAYVASPTQTYGYGLIFTSLVLFVSVVGTMRKTGRKNTVG